MAAVNPSQHAQALPLRVYREEESHDLTRLFNLTLLAGDNALLWQEQIKVFGLKSFHQLTQFRAEVQKIVFEYLNDGMASPLTLMAFQIADERALLRGYYNLRFVLPLDKALKAIEKCRCVVEDLEGDPHEKLQDVLVLVEGEKKRFSRNLPHFCEEGLEPFVDILLSGEEAGANKDEAFLVSAQRGLLPIFIRLYAHFGGPISSQSLMEALKGGHLPILEFSLSKENPMGEVLKAATHAAIPIHIFHLLLKDGKFNGKEYGEALFEAVAERQWDRALAILKRAPEIDVENRNLVLPEAAQNPNGIHVVQQLLTQGQISQATKEAAILCCKGFEILQLLLAAGPISKHCRGKALFRARQDKRATLLLLQNGPIDNEAREKAVMGATKKGSFEVLDLLLDSGPISNGCREGALLIAAGKFDKGLLIRILRSGFVSEKAKQEAREIVKDKEDLVALLNNKQVRDQQAAHKQDEDQQ